jgi:hypothetical protein
MGSKSAPPPPPDVKTESQKSVDADLSTLATRRAAELGASQGVGYYAGGKYYKTKDDLAADLAQAQKDYAAGGGKDATLKQRISDLQNPQDFSGLGDSAYAQNSLNILLDANDQVAQRQLALRQKLGVADVEQSVAELKAADPGSWDMRQKLMDDVQKDQVSPELSKLYNDAAADYALGSQLDDSTAREVEQAVRSAQTARGNVLGSAAATQEAMARGDAGYQRKLQRTQNLANIENQVAGRKQQQLSDMSAFLNNGVVGQFGALSGAQNGAVGFNPVQSKGGTNIASNAVQMGLGFAQNNYQGQMQAWQSSQGNPWTNILSGAAGMALGSMTGGLGTSIGTGLGKKLMG